MYFVFGMPIEVTSPLKQQNLFFFWQTRVLNDINSSDVDSKTRSQRQLCQITECESRTLADDLNANLELHSLFAHI